MGLLTSLPHHLVMAVKVLLCLCLCGGSFAQFQHFFGPPAIGFGVGLVSVRRNFPVATSIVSRRSTRSYSQQSFTRSSPFGVTATNSRSYSHTDHFYAANNLNYYQPTSSTTTAPPGITDGVVQRMIRQRRGGQQSWLRSGILTPSPWTRSATWRPTYLWPIRTISGKTT